MTSRRRRPLRASGRRSRGARANRAPPETARAIAALRRAARRARRIELGVREQPAPAGCLSSGHGLFDRDALAERVRRIRILLQHLGIGRAGRVALAEPGQRQAELQERVGRLAALRIGLVAGEELVRRLAILAAGEEALAEPVLRVRRALRRSDRWRGTAGSRPRRGRSRRRGCCHRRARSRRRGSPRRDAPGAGAAGAAGCSAPPRAIGGEVDRLVLAARRATTCRTAAAAASVAPVVGARRAPASRAAPARRRRGDRRRRRRPRAAGPAVWRSAEGAAPRPGRSARGCAPRRGRAAPSTSFGRERHLARRLRLRWRARMRSTWSAAAAPAAGDDRPRCRGRASTGHWMRAARGRLRGDRPKPAIASEGDGAAQSFMVSRRPWRIVRRGASEPPPTASAHSHSVA